LHLARYDRITLCEEREIAPVDARSVAAVTAAVLTAEAHQGACYCVTGPERLSLSELADKLSFATGVRVGDFSQAGDCEARWLSWDMTIITELASAPDVSKINLGGALRRIVGREPIWFDEYAAEIAERCPMFKHAR
jgi:uncharacterized protein YbjT (DUF2867 family)